MTDHTTIDRALLEQALKALEYHTQQTRPIQKTEHAILAIRAELAKPDRPIKDSWHFERLDKLLSLCLSEPAYSDYLDSLKRVAGFSAELAKPVERVEPITLDQFRAIANRTATTYRHRSDPEKSSYAFVDGSSLDDFWRKVCEAIQSTPAWRDAPEVAALKAEHDAQLAIYDEVIDNLQSQVDELVAALKGVIRVADRKTDEFDAARAAIAKAEGRTE